MFGKRSIARYRTGSSAFPLEYKDDLQNRENISLIVNRHGDEKNQGGEVYLYKLTYSWDMGCCLENLRTGAIVG